MNKAKHNASRKQKLWKILEYLMVGLLVLFFFILAYSSEKNAEDTLKQQLPEATADPYRIEDSILEAWGSSEFELHLADSVLLHPNGTQIRYEMETEAGLVCTLRIHTPLIAEPKEADSLIGEGLQEQYALTREAIVQLLEKTFPQFQLPLSEVESFVYECEQTLENGRVYTLTGRYYFAQAYRDDSKAPATLMISIRRSE